MNTQKILYCRIGWAQSYDGTLTDAPQNGGSYNDTKVGFEIYNFKPYAGMYYGYVKIHGSIRIDKNFGSSANAPYTHGVLVVWVAKHPAGGEYVVGWYKNATVYRKYKGVPEGAMAERALKDHNICAMYAEEKDCRLLAESERTYRIDGMGQSNTWYGNAVVNEQVAAYIAGV